MNNPSHVVTGAFGYSGKYIAKRLIEQGTPVATLTNSPKRPNELGVEIHTMPLQFDDIEALTKSLGGVDVLYNTYWVRFDYKLFNHQIAIQNTETLFAAAKRAGVRRVVHVSITNPSADSPLPYFAGKARLEQTLIESGLSYAILRPAVLFGREDILVNNIAWALRTFPIFGIFGPGNYRLRPIHVDDLAALAVAAGARKDNTIMDAVGPESFSYRELVVMMARALSIHRPVLSIPPWLGHVLSRLIGFCYNDVFITKEEIAGLMANLLDTSGPATGSTRLSSWVTENAAFIGKTYASELRRRRQRASSYLLTASSRPSSTGAVRSGGG